MEALIEIILEIVVNLLGELIATGCSAIASYYDSHDKIRNNSFKILLYIFYILCIILVTLSIIYNKAFLIIIVLSYILCYLIYSLFRSLNKNIFKKKWLKIILVIFKKLISYAYPIILIIFGTLNLTNVNAKVWLIVLSSIGIFVMFVMDIYRLTRISRYINE